MTTPLGTSDFSPLIASTDKLRPGYIELRRKPCEFHNPSCVTKNVIIMHKPYGREHLFFHDHNLRLILDSKDLMAATCVFIINDICLDGSLKGKLLKKFDAVPFYVQYCPYVMSKLKFETENGDIEVKSPYDLISRAFPEKDAIKQIIFS